MTNRERFRNVMNFKPVDRLPVIEWAGWWNKTIERWRAEGLPASLSDAWEIRAHLGLDSYRQETISPFAPEFPYPAHGMPAVLNAADYDRLLPLLYPRPPCFNPRVADAWGAEQRAGDTVVWISLIGFFWGPRTLLGIENHLCAFYDNAELMKRINEDLLEYNLRSLEAYCDHCVPDFMTFAEDMSYNHGAMISKELFDEFLAPYYRRIVPELRKRGIKVLVDTDGMMHDLVPWFLDNGFDGFLPLERMAGVDVNLLRQRHPTLLMIGAFDKTVMHRGEAAMRSEFERLLPVMRSGGFIPSVDHQTPPEVGLADYKTYVRLLKEYAFAAVSGGTELGSELLPASGSVGDDPGGECRCAADDPLHRAGRL